MATKTDYAVGEFYHIYTRGVDHRWVFMDTSDSERFYSSLFLFNDKNYTNPGGRSDEKLFRLCFAETTQYDTRDRLVDIVTFNMLNNQLHAVMVPRVEDGVSRFMHKVLMGYSKYFGKKYERVGALFETYKAKAITSQPYLNHMVPYAHLNTFDMFGVPWRDGVVENWEQVVKLLDDHPWSGHHVAMRRQQKLPVISEEYLHGMYQTPEEYLEHLKGWSTREILDFQIP